MLDGPPQRGCQTHRHPLGIKLLFTLATLGSECQDESVKLIIQEPHQEWQGSLQSIHKALTEGTAASQAVWIHDLFWKSSKLNLWIQQTLCYIAIHSLNFHNVFSFLKNEIKYNIKLTFLFSLLYFLM